MKHKNEVVKNTIVAAVCALCFACATAPVVEEEPISKPQPVAATKETEKPAAATVQPTQPTLTTQTQVEDTGILVGYKTQLPFYVYKDRISRENHYIPSGWMGDYGDIKLNENWRENPKEGVSCIRIEYSAKRSQGQGWAGIYWQNPANNWGTIKGGFDLRGATKLTFYARGEKGGEICEFKMGGIRGEYSDSDASTTGPVQLTKGWKKFTIDLKGLDLSYISGGFCWVVTANDNPDGCVIYLDEIVYEK
ncbi:MAG: hypothetical protein NZ928_06255 [Endomicrobia bacterium]|nr:hypothetical protein [Endomicrobiia bacterium]